MKKIKILLPFLMLVISMVLSTRFCRIFAGENERGKMLYEKNCAQCHGLDGTPFMRDSDGMFLRDPETNRAILKSGTDWEASAASFMNPLPRDFTSGTYKIRTTPSGSPPTDDDLKRSIMKGLPGTTMPAWKGVLSNSDVGLLVEYIKSFSPVFEEESPEVIQSFRLPRANQESLEKGKELYASMQCFQCHGRPGRGNGPSAFSFGDDWGYKLLPADLTQPWNFRGGGEAQDIYMRLTAGVSGTPMPSYADAISEEERGHLANYVASLGHEPNFSSYLPVQKVAGKLPSDFEDLLWKESGSVDFRLAGQVIAGERNFTPSVKSIQIWGLYNDEEITFLLEWHDRTESIEGQPDSLALEFPEGVPENEKPYFLYGQTGRPVDLWKWTAGRESLQYFKGEGIGELTEKFPSISVWSKAEYDDGRWRLIVRRQRETPDKESIDLNGEKSIPVAFFIWDGDAGEVGGRSAVSTWYSFVLSPPKSIRVFIYPPFAFLMAAGAQFWICKKYRKTT